MLSKKKGNNYELQIAQKFRDAGYVDCVTSRSESKRLDDAGVDLCNTGSYHVQCKAQERLSTNLHDILKNMPKDKMGLVFWKRNRKGSVVTMSEEDFWIMLRLINERDL